MSLYTNKSDLTDVSNTADTFLIRNYLSSPDMNKHQTYIDIKTVTPPLMNYRQI